MFLSCWWLAAKNTFHIQNPVSFHCKHLEVHFTGVKKTRAGGPTVKTTTGAATAEWVFGSGDDWLCRGAGCETASGVRAELQVVISHMATWQQFQLQNVSRFNRCIAALLMKGLKSSAAGRTYREAPPTSTATPRFNLHNFSKLSIRSDGHTASLSGLGLNSFVPFCPQ